MYRLNFLNLKGGLGNQLFQLSYVYSQHKSLHFFAIDLSSYRSDVFKRQAISLGILANKVRLVFSFYPLISKIIWAVFRYGYYLKSILTDECHTNDSLPYTNVTFRIPWLGVSFYDGYFQSVYKRADAFIYDLNLYLSRYIKENPCSQSFHAYAEIKSATCSVGLHIRGGDYRQVKTRSLYPECNTLYYHTCLDIISSRCAASVKVFVFTNDRPYAQCILNAQPHSYVIFDIASEWHTMNCFSSCSHYVLSNSSFAWWAAEIGSTPESIVCVPKRWSADGIESPFISDTWISV